MLADLSLRTAMIASLLSLVFGLVLLGLPARVGDEDDGAETLGDGDDTVFGGAGQDVLDGAGGDDRLSGGDGQDALWGGAGDDRLHGGRGDDMLDGGTGDDIATGDQGNDRIALGAGNDILRDAGLVGDQRDDDSVDGGAGDDFLTDLSGRDLLSGGSGADRIVATDAPGLHRADSLFGGDGDDDLTGDDGDTLTGGAGRDSFAVSHDWTGDRPVRIADFERGEHLFIRSDLAEDAEPELRLADNGQDTEVLLAGRLVAVIEGWSRLPSGSVSLAPAD